MTGFREVAAADYHADRVADGPTLSASVAKAIVGQSPWHGWLRHPRLGAGAAESTPDQDRGTLLHALTLEKGREQVVAVAAKDFRTKLAQEIRDRARAEGKTPVLAAEFDAALETAGAIRAAVAAETGVDLLAEGRREQVVVWEEATAHGVIRCRGMLDWSRFSARDGLVLDLKTCQDAHPRACAAHVLKYGHHLQAAAYASGVAKVLPDLEGRVDFAWVFVEVVPPPRRAVVTVARPDGLMQELGRSRWRRACETWAKCLKENHWPAYESAGGHRLEAPAWAVREELGEDFAVL